VTTTYGYDVLNRLRSKAYSGGETTSDVTLEYDTDVDHHRRDGGDFQGRAVDASAVWGYGKPVPV